MCGGTTAGLVFSMAGQQAVSPIDVQRELGQAVSAAQATGQGESCGRNPLASGHAVAEVGPQRNGAWAGEEPLRDQSRAALGNVAAPPATKQDVTQARGMPLVEPRQSRQGPWCEDNFGFSDYFETQVGAWCGMHALNNLLGGPYVSQDACCRAAQEVCRRLSQVGGDAEDRDHHLDPDTGWLSIDVINMLGASLLGISTCQPCVVHRLFSVAVS